MAIFLVLPGVPFLLGMLIYEAYLRLPGGRLIRLSEPGLFPYFQGDAVLSVAKNTRAVSRRSTASSGRSWRWSVSRFWIGRARLKPGFTVDSATEAPRIYIRRIYPLQALERTHGDVALLHEYRRDRTHGDIAFRHEYRQNRRLSPERGIRYSSTDKRPWNSAKGIDGDRSLNAERCWHEFRISTGGFSQAYCTSKKERRRTTWPFRRTALSPWLHTWRQSK